MTVENRQGVRHAQEREYKAWSITASHSAWDSYLHRVFVRIGHYCFASSAICSSRSRGETDLVKIGPFWAFQCTVDAIVSETES